MTTALRLVLPVVLVYAAGFGMQQAPARDTVAQQNVGTALVSGTITHRISGQPVRRVTVVLSNNDRNLRLAAVTDETGKFAFAELPDGRYLLSASRPGFVSVTYGATRPERPGTPIALASGEQRTAVTLRLSPGAVITGTVRTRTSEPVPGARVIILRSAPSYLTGEPSLAPVAGGFIGQVTDDRGEYRAFGLPAGEYYVVALASIGTLSGPELRETSAAEIEWAGRQLQSPGSVAPPEPGRAVDYVPVFFPGALTQASAATVTVKDGEERAGVDIPLEVVPTGKINGQVVSPAGDLPPTLQINVIAHDTIPGVPFSGFGTARADATGRFVSAGLAPGDYTITVRVPPGPRGAGAGTAAIFGLAKVSISGGDVDTIVTLGSGITVSGRLVFEGAGKPPADLTRVRVNLEAERGRTPTLGVAAVMGDAGGNFQIVGVLPGRYRLTAAGAGGWFVRNATIGGRDSLDVAVEIGDRDVTGAEIIFTDEQTEISGDLLDAAGKPAPEYFIIIYPADRKYWLPQSRRVQSTRPGNDGKYRVQNLPPGDYLIAAVTDVQQNEWYDPAFLAQLVGGSTKITLGEGEKKAQSLRIKR
jgi:hypothetical protein